MDADGEAMFLAAYFFNCVLVFGVAVFGERLVRRRVDVDSLDEARRRFVEMSLWTGRWVVFAMFVSGAVFWVLRSFGASSGVATIGLVVVCLAPYPIALPRLMKAARTTEAPAA